MCAIGAHFQLLTWYKPIIKQSASKSASTSLKRMVKNLDNTILKFCKYQTKQLMLEVLILVGNLEGYVSRYTVKVKLVITCSAVFIKKF